MEINHLQVELVKENSLLEKDFRSLSTFKEVADLLEVPSKLLYETLIKNKTENYRKFQLNKKSGGKRTIYSPQTNLSIIQKKLAYILNLIYSPHKNAHGFVEGASVVSNAKNHVKQYNVLNFDLEDFFPSINYGRVRAMFISYFKFNKSISSTLANICCHHKGFLPQGAATSPIIANIISYRMDKNLTSLAERYNCKYTRYADDITLSTSRAKFPDSIVIKDTNSKTILSEKIQSIVRKNGFKINHKKTRLRNKYQRLEVTGITVNEKLNINRSYIRYIRVILHCIEKYKDIDQIEEAVKIFNKKYSFRQRKKQSLPDMFKVLRGMISYVGQVKGKNNEVFIKLAKRYNKVATGQEQPFLSIPLPPRIFQEKHTYVIESLDYEYSVEGIPFNDLTTFQGSAFLLKGVGLVTNVHVIKDLIEAIECGYTVQKINIHQSIYGNDSFGEVLYYNRILDIAILKVDDIDINKVGFDYEDNVHLDMDVKIIGYPEYIRGMGLSVRDSKVISQRKTLEHEGNSEIRYEVSSTIFKGNSGGPVVNNENKVVGVAVKGQDHPNEIIPIKDAVLVFEEKQRKF